MKKTLNLICLLIFITLIISCKEEREYEHGDRVVIDHIIYEYVDPKQVDAPYYDYRTADILDSDKPLYHSCYPFDMINPEKIPINSDMFNEENWGENVYIISSRYGHNLPSDENFIEDEYGLVQSRHHYFATDMDCDLVYANYAFNNPSFWVVGCDGETDDVRIKNKIDNILVAGIGYAAFARETRSGTQDINNVIIEEVDNQILKYYYPNYYPNVTRKLEGYNVPLLIMPYAFSNLNIGEILCDRQLLVYPLGFNNVSSYSIKFNYRIFLLNQAFYKCEISHTAYENTLFSSQLDTGYLYINNIATTLTRRVDVFSYDAAFVDCDFYVVLGTRVFLHETGLIYLYPNSRYYCFPVLISNGKIKDGSYCSKPKELCLSMDMFMHVYAENDKVKSYLFDSELNSELDHIYIIVRENWFSASYNKEENADLYIDSANSKIYYRAYVKKDNGDAYYKYIHLLDIPQNCNIVILESTKERRLDGWYDVG